MLRYIKFFDDVRGVDTDVTLGNKGSKICDMYHLGINVPCGFVIRTELCRIFFANDCKLPDDFDGELRIAVAKLEARCAKFLGNIDNPLLLSIRSGASVSMPGMMDSILNFGITQKMIGASGGILASQAIAQRCYDNLMKSCGAYYNDHDLFHSLKIGIINVLLSWKSQRARIYRTLHSIDDSVGTGVVVQEMVFGNLNELSGTGVLFTRSPVDGKKQLYGEYIAIAQGEEIVSGTTNPSDISSVNLQNIELITEWAYKLESYYRDMQDIEFTIESGELYFLQTRSGKRSIFADIKIICDFVEEGLISKQEAINRIDVEHLEELMHATIHDELEVDNYDAIATPAAPGAVCGVVALTVQSALALSRVHEHVILLRPDTSPDDIEGIHVSSAIVTAFGGVTSHAAVVARGMGKSCICGFSKMSFIKNNAGIDVVLINDKMISDGDIITIDGSSGKIYLREMKISLCSKNDDLDLLMQWVKESNAKLQVFVNAETVSDIMNGLKFAALGVGLCRTEHMLFNDKKLELIRSIILLQNPDKKEECLLELEKLHQADFLEIFSILHGATINIRLLDPPLHEFLPHDSDDLLALAKTLSMDLDSLRIDLAKLREVNPMLGHRGCRLGITYPDIYIMQLRAIFSAAKVLSNDGSIVNLEIMLPLISDEGELIFLKKIMLDVAMEYDFDHAKGDYKIGTMIELPRAALVADKLAVHVDYFSFGTNDLTQTVYGISRDDSSNFMYEYMHHKIFKDDPFVVLDDVGVGALMRHAIALGRSVNPHLKIGVCGEHAGNIQSIRHMQHYGLDYISCSPYRVLLARIAVAQNVDLVCGVD